MKRIIGFSGVFLLLAQGAAAEVTLSGRVTKKWNASMPIAHVEVTVLTLDGKSVLGQDKTDANGDYSIRVARVPKARKVWVRYELEGWERKPANYVPVKLDGDANRHSAQLSPKNMSDDEAASFGTQLRAAEAAGEDVQEARAIASRLPAATQARIAAAYAASFAPEQRDQQAKLAMQSFEESDTRYRLQQRIASLAALVEELAFVRERSDGKLVLTLYDAYFDAGKKTVPDDKKADYDVIARWIAAANPASIRVEGHADATGPAAVNSHLARQRAETVRRILIDGGVSPSAVQAIGMGEANAEYLPGANAAAYHNRRVDVVISIDKDVMGVF